MNEAYTVGIVGATGAVGRELIRLLCQRGFPLADLKLLASARSRGKILSHGDQSWEVEEATPEAFEGVDLALFSAGSGITAKLAPEAVRRGCVVIDNSSAFRMEPTVPLVVPEINPEAAAHHSGIIANPNCSTIGLTMALKPIADRFGVHTVAVTTMQALSGAGYPGIPSLEILDNVLPFINEEEDKMERETLKLFAGGMSYAKIAEARGNKTASVRNAVYRIQDKLGVESMQEVVIWAVKHGLMDDAVGDG